jgi:hypothetical protein
MRKVKYEHVVLNTITGDLVCEHCRERFPMPAPPVRLDMYIGIMELFTKLHKDCEPIPQR